MPKFTTLATASALALLTCGTALAGSADLVITNARVITMDETRTRAEAVATQGNTIVYVGDAAGAEALTGPDTRVIDAGGKIVLPGLHDSHIHPLFNVTPVYQGERYDCNFEGMPTPLDETVARLRGCLAEAELNPDGWLIGQYFDPPSLLAVTEDYPTVRAALDAVSADVPIVLEGSDGHAFGFNSAALRAAHHPESGAALAVTGETLGGEYAPYADYFNLGADGEPDGTAKEFAAHIIGAPKAGLENYKPVLGELSTLMASNGVTSALDALVTDELAGVYEHMEAEGMLNFRLRLNTHIDANLYGGRHHALDMDAAMEAARNMRSRFESSDYIKGDGVKMFVDGVVEYPTQTAAMLTPYLQPKIEGSEISGYIDLDSPLCVSTRDTIDAFDDEAAQQRFEAEHGFSPLRCVKNYGLLEFEAEELKRAVAAFDGEGFTVHMHTIGDRAVRTALDAVQHARDINGNSGILHALSHVQFVAPQDIPRFAELNAAAAPTMAWAVPYWSYDVTVNPYINEVKSLTDMAEMYRQDGAWAQLSYPLRSLQEAGAILSAGSDAPVDVPSPQPFVNIAAGLIRGDLLPVDPTSDDENQEVVPVLVNADEVLTLDQALAAYTVNGAKALGQEELTGSLETGKRADLILISADIEALSQNIETIWDIAGTEVLMTVFDGRVVHSAQ